MEERKKKLKEQRENQNQKTVVPGSEPSDTKLAKQQSKSGKTISDVYKSSDSSSSSRDQVAHRVIATRNRSRSRQSKTETSKVQSHPKENEKRCSTRQQTSQQYRPANKNQKAEEKDKESFKDGDKS